MTDNVQAMCDRSNFPADFQILINQLNVSIAFSQEMTSAEDSVKGALKGLSDYSRGAFLINNYTLH